MPRPETARLAHLASIATRHRTDVLDGLEAEGLEYGSADYRETLAAIAASLADAARALGPSGAEVIDAARLDLEDAAARLTYAGGTDDPDDLEDRRQATEALADAAETYAAAILEHDGDDVTSGDLAAAVALAVHAGATSGAHGPAWAR